MKKSAKTKSSKLSLERETLNNLQLTHVEGAEPVGGISVGTCNACNPTYNPSCCGCYGGCV